MVKNHAKYGLVLCIGIVVGLIVGVLLGGFVVGKSSTTTINLEKEDDLVIKENLEYNPKEENQKENGLDDQVDLSKVEEESSTHYSDQTYLESDCPLWSVESIYVGEDLVIYEGKIYKAKWWTQGEVPTESEVWEVTKINVEELVSTSQLLQGKEVEVVNTQIMTEDEFKVVAYYPSWKANQLEKIDYSVVTHVIYAFAIPTSEGNLLPLENEELAKFIIKEAHANQRKVLLAIGGWSYQEIPLETTFMKATNTPEKIQALGDAIIKMCNEYGFDGVDMDWEHPRYDGTSEVRYETLMLYLAEKLHQQDKLLTAAVISGVTAQGQVYYDAAAHTDAVLDQVDWLNVMAYDGGDGASHSSYDFAIDSGNYWKETRGLESGKIALGVPFYGRPSWASYEEILAEVSDGYGTDLSTYKGMQVYYNGVDTIKKKTEYAKGNFGGIMIWEITQDTSQKEYSLLQGIKEVLSK